MTRRRPGEGTLRRYPTRKLIPTMSDHAADQNPPRFAPQPDGAQAMARTITFSMPDDSYRILAAYVRGRVGFDPSGDIDQAIGDAVLWGFWEYCSVSGAVDHIEGVEW